MKIEIHKRLRTERPLRPVDTPWLTGRRTKWRVIEDWTVWVDGVRYVVPAGYVFDGSSIPALLWWLFPPTYSPAWEASCFHDICYSHWYGNVNKQFADNAFRAIMIEQGAKPWVAAVFYKAVHWFGKSGW